MLNSHIVKNLISKFFGLGVNLINQIVLIPFYIKYWGVDKYGDWIILSTIMSFFSMSNVGFNDVIANKFVIAFTEKQYDSCRKYLTNNYILLFLITMFCLLGLLIFTTFYNVNLFFGTRVTVYKDVIFVTYFLFFQVMTAQFSAVFNAVYRAVKKTYIAFYLEDGAKLIELVIMFFCIYYNTSLPLLVALLFLPKCIVWIYKFFDIPNYFNYKFYIRDFDIRIIKKTAIPSLTFMAFPAGYAIMNQGFTLLVAKNFSAEKLILFNTTRTLCNFIKSMSGIFQSSIWPEFSIAFGERNYDIMRSLHRKSLYLSIVLTIGIGITLLIFGPLIYRLWTHEQIGFDYNLMLVFLITLLFGNIWYSSSVVLMSTNNHSKLGVLFLFLNSISLILGYLFFNIWQSLPIVVLALLFSDLTLSIFTLRQSLKFTEDSFGDILRSISISRNSSWKRH